MAKFRKKPVVIEAEQWFPGVEMDGLDITHGEPGADYGSGIAGAMVFVKTLEGRMQVKPGDWIITGVNGERYPCKPDIFEKTYNTVDGDTLKERVIRDLGFSMGVATERDIAFFGLWVSRRANGSLCSTACDIVDEPMTDELRAQIAEVLRRLADTVQAKPDPNTATVA